MTVTVAVCVIETALAVAEIVLACATVELNFVAKIPLAFDVLDALGLNTLLDPDTVTVTDEPLIRLLKASRTVTTMLSASKAA